MQHSKTTLILSLAVVVVFSILLYHYWNFFGFLSVFVKDALWASVLATIVLVFINAVSTWQNRQTVKEMEKARKDEFRPIVKIQLGWKGLFSVIVKGTNHGKGPAINVEADITFLPSNEKTKWTEPIFAPNETHQIPLPECIHTKACEKAAEIMVKGRYYDIFGKQFPIDERFDTKRFIDENLDLHLFSAEWKQSAVASQLSSLQDDLMKKLDDANSKLDKIAERIEPKKP